MAKGKKYTHQFPFVGTEEQYEILKAAAERTGMDKAPFLRAGLNLLVGLGPDDELVDGDTREAAIERLVAAMTPAESVPAN